MNKFDTFLEIIIINRTANLFKNLCLGFFTVGDVSSSASGAKSSLDSIDNLMLREHETLTVYKTLKITPKDASVISANLSYEHGMVTNRLIAGYSEFRDI
jgi:vesicle coat complex subunit